MPDKIEQSELVRFGRIAYRLAQVPGSFDTQQNFKNDVQPHVAAIINELLVYRAAAPAAPLAVVGAAPRPQFENMSRPQLLATAYPGVELPVMVICDSEGRENEESPDVPVSICFGGGPGLSEIVQMTRHEAQYLVDAANAYSQENFGAAALAAPVAGGPGGQMEPAELADRIIRGMPAGITISGNIIEFAKFLLTLSPATQEAGGGVTDAERYKSALTSSTHTNQVLAGRLQTVVDRLPALAQLLDAAVLSADADEPNDGYEALYQTATKMASELRVLRRDINGELSASRRAQAALPLLDREEPAQ